MITRSTSRVRCPYPFAGDCDALLPTGGKFQSSSSKSQTNHKCQLPTTSRHLRFGGWSLFGIWCLRFENYRKSRCFGTLLSPVHYRRRAPRPVSYYALFKWWLLLSQHPGCHRSPTSFRTEQSLGTLAGDLGCSPLDDEAYPPPSICRASPRGIRSLVRIGSRVGPYSDSVALPPRVSARR